MLSGISNMNSYYSIYRYGFSHGSTPVRSAPAVLNRNPPAAAPETPGRTAPSPEISASRPAISSGGRLYLGSPADGSQAGGDASVSDLMRTPEELAVQMRIQYLDPATAAFGKQEELPALSKQETDVPGNEAVEKLDGSEECQTCKQRKYQDGSDDMGVSFKTPTHVAPEAAASAVRGHEQEHVVREQAKAEREDRRVVSQDVTLHTGICPECGKVYISGGTTRTVTAAKSDSPVEDILTDASGQEPENREPFQAVA